MPIVSVNLLTFNAKKYIGPCLDSVLTQTYPGIEVLVIDNNSTDETAEYLEEIKSQISNLKIIFNQENLGFAAGHNQGIRESRGEFILCLNQDVILDKDFVREAVNTLEKDREIAAVQGKVYRFLNPREFAANIANKIDTTGLVVLKNRRIISRGQGQIDEGQYDNSEEIFGADGAVPVYRRKALEDIKMPLLKSDSYEYFDESFFMYKEDVDLAWRFRLYGWKAVYQPKAIAWHIRSAGDSAAVSYFRIIKERLKINNFAKYLSFKNQRLTQIKNEQISILLEHLPWFFPKEIASWLYVILFERYTYKAIRDLFKEAPLAFRKRKIIMSRKKAGRGEIKKWFK